MFKLIKAATAAGLLGLVILNPKPFSALVSASSAAFRNAVRLGQ
jgi:hypothetical protein